MPQVVINDTLISYTDSGKGPVLLCVHGWMLDSKSFDSLQEELKDEFRIIAVDLPNFGKSAMTNDIYSVDHYADFLLALTKKLKLTHYVLIGHSMGAQIAVRAVGKKALSPAALVLIGAAGIRDTRRAYKIVLQFVSKLLKHITPRQLKKRMYAAIGSDYDPDLSSIHKKIITQTLKTDILADAHGLKVPTVLIFGSLDTSTPVWMGEKLANAINGSRLEIIEGENHWVHQTSAPKTAVIIREFLDASKD